jgi:hypothetical protein
VRPSPYNEIVRMDAVPTGFCSLALAVSSLDPALVMQVSQSADALGISRAGTFHHACKDWQKYSSTAERLGLPCAYWWAPRSFRQGVSADCYRAPTSSRANCSTAEGEMPRSPKPGICGDATLSICMSST